MKDVKTILILVLGLIIVLLYTCKGDIKPSKTITKTITRVDSLRTTDTLERLIYVPIVTAPIIDTVYINDTISKYHYGSSDSLLEYNVYIYAEKPPQKVDFQYQLKNFTIYDSIFIRDSTHVKEKIKSSFISLGVTALGNSNSFGFAPTIVYHHKSGSNFGAGYDLLNSTMHLQFTKKISFK